MRAVVSSESDVLPLVAPLGTMMRQTTVVSVAVAVLLVIGGFAADLRAPVDEFVWGIGAVGVVAVVAIVFVVVAHPLRSRGLDAISAVLQDDAVREADGLRLHAPVLIATSPACASFVATAVSLGQLDLVVAGAIAAGMALVSGTVLVVVTRWEARFGLRVAVARRSWRTFLSFAPNELVGLESVPARKSR